MFVKLFKQFTEQAGWFYSNQVRQEVKFLGIFNATYSAGSKSSDGKRHFLFLNDEEAQAEGENLPNSVMYNPDTGECMKEEDYKAQAIGNATGTATQPTA